MTISLNKILLSGWFLYVEIKVKHNFVLPSIEFISVRYTTLQYRAT